ncbi:hypothetical protein KO498_14905 [Lentibacter algarum]|uniref:NfeD family protein n=1 Tax=Lentibacter algarum TaxID=576131 RepID=UPI001C08DB30|nr:hypothetical protein [Lentibacter algarum]MBU2983099.1 hypothetical protein [Lentibacter algarum]
MEEVASTELWTNGWAWFAAAVALGILELFAPGFILLGFAIGAGVVGILLGIGGPVSTFLAGSFATTFLLFALFSLVGWLVMRRVAGVRHGQVKVWETDINDD